MSTQLADRVRQDFPILNSLGAGRRLVYLDNASTTQKPQAVIDAISNYYTNDNANIHRGQYDLSHRATEGYEGARRKVASFINAGAPEECLFVRGTTEAINLVASSWGNANLSPGDEIIVSGLEHHSNIVPWQLACARTGAELKVWYSNDDGELELESLRKLLNERTKLLAIQHVSNALGTIHDVALIAREAKETGALVLVDGAQWIAHGPTDVQQLGCDFYAFSGHKLYGPTGIGVLWGRQELLEKMPPYQGGGDMIETVSFSKTTYAALPNRFEAGTPDIAGAIGLKAAIDYVESIGFDAIQRAEQEVLDYATRQLATVPGLRILGNAKHKAAVVSFVLESPPIAPMDIASFLNRSDIAVRTGHHCCMPLMSQLHVPGTTRASMAMYNGREDIDALVEQLQELVASRKERQSQTQARNPSDAESETGISFGPAQGNSSAAAADALAEEFLEFDDRESKTELLMELGQALPDQFAALKAISTAVPGCMSEVYLVGRPQLEDETRFEFAADSNAEIVRGLIAVLLHVFSGQPAADVVEFDIEQFFRRIGLDEFVSTQRRSGLNGMINRIQALAGAITQRQN